MELLGIHVPHPAGPELDRLLTQARQAELTYDYVGAMVAPGGPRPSERRGRVELGRGDQAFAKAVEALRTWQAHQGIGASIHPAGAPIELDETVLVVLRAGPFAVVAPDRLVAVIDEPGRFGFAYGTLTGHPETGEESYLVEQAESGLVTLTIRVDARPGTLPARLAGPIVRRIQHWALGRYLEAVRTYVAPASAGSS
jgi:uncharacterized protein (UPF0548 family)